MEKLYASLKLYLLCDHIELGILIVLGIVNLVLVTVPWCASNSLVYFSTCY